VPPICPPPIRAIFFRAIEGGSLKCGGYLTRSGGGDKAQKIGRQSMSKKKKPDCITVRLVLRVEEEA